MWQLGTYFLNWLYPVTCCVCQHPGQYLCEACFDGLNFYTTCPVPIPAPAKSMTVMAHYQPPLSNIIQAAKFNHLAGVGAWLGKQLYYHCSLPTADLITAIPPDQRRWRQRGFHLPYQIGQQLSVLTGIPFQPLLIKPRSTTAQMSVPNPIKRQQNLAGAFSPHSLPVDINPTTCRVMLIDDVVTTGATCSEAARVLKDVGFQTIQVVCVAHGQ